MKSVLARLCHFLVSSTRPVTRSQMAPQTIQWCVDYPILLPILEHEPSADLNVCPGTSYFASHQACWE
jgi:hypothetical protein